jgi:hypothetical protein
MVGRSRIQLAIAEIEPARLPRIFTLYYSHLQGCGCAAQGARGFDFNTGSGAAETVLAARGDQWYQYAQSHSAHSDADRLEIDGGNRNRTRLPIMDRILSAVLRPEIAAGLTESAEPEHGG